MVRRMDGVIRGSHIELAEAPRDWADGTPVSISISPPIETHGARREAVDRLCGAWGADPSIDAVFSAIVNDRNGTAEQPIDFDDSD